MKVTALLLLLVAGAFAAAYDEGLSNTDEEGTCTSNICTEIFSCLRCII